MATHRQLDRKGEKDITTAVVANPTYARQAYSGNDEPLFLRPLSLRKKMAEQEQQKQA